MRDEFRHTLVRMLGLSDFKKGERYPKRYIDYKGHIINNGNPQFNFKVESESSYRFYDVKIVKKGEGTYSANCTCPQFFAYNKCKHIAACFYNHGKEIFDFNLEKLLRKNSLDLIKSFVSSNEISGVKKELTLEVELNELYGRQYELKLKLGEQKTYILKKKMGDFFEAYKNKTGEVEFGKNFIYNPIKHYLNSKDAEIIDYVYDIVSEKYQPFYANNYNIVLTSRQLKALLKILKNKPFTTYNTYGFFNIKEIKEENPFNPIISKKDKEYYFDLNMKDIKPLTSDYEYVFKDKECFHITDKYSNLIESMQSKGLDQLIFEEKDLQTFSKAIVPLVKEEIVVDKSVENLVIVKKPECKLYFDIYHNDIVCNLKLKYGEKELNYFDNIEGIARDTEYENTIISDILELGFEIQNNKFILSDIDKIGEFFESNLEKIASKYDTYTSEKIKNTKILKNSPVTSTFSIGTDNIMSFSFDLGNISNKELDNIFDNLTRKKRYYKLKSGDILDLENNESLRQLEELANDLNLSSKELAAGNGIIPKYRAIYLDSLKKDKYNIIKTNNLFDTFIDNFKNYKGKKIKLTKKEKEVLRDYQETGVEWLYNIHKCDLGGILADEMGLGKSIQVIYFFKKLLEEDKNHKFLIVSPTSLVYNWKQEFDKFAPKIKYEILSNGKERRHDLLEHTKANVYITSYGLLREDLEIYKEKQFTICVIDEAQNIKNPVSGITKAVKKINAQTKLALTGTPIENSVVELWSIFDYIMPGFFSVQKDFQSKYKVKDFDEDTNKLLSKLNKQISPFILRRRKKDVLTELPEKIENNIFIDLSNDQKKLYASEVKRVRKEMDDLIRTEGFSKARFMILQLLTKLRQLCIDPKLVFDNYKGESTKMENLVNVVKELIDNGHKILLFSSFKSALELVAKEFKKNDITFYEINGEVSSKKRMDLVTKFNNDNTNVFLITLKAGGTGLTLTSADVVIHLDLWWNPQAENQATDRAHRIGQKNTVSVIKLVARGTIEEKILELQEKKKMLSDKIIEGDTRDKNNIGELSEKDLRNLLAYEQEENN